MADNMASRTDELVIDIQQHGQMSLFDQTAENEYIDLTTIKSKMTDILNKVNVGIHANKLLAIFFTNYGVLCKSGQIKKYGERWRIITKSLLIVDQPTPIKGI